MKSASALALVALVVGGTVPRARDVQPAAPAPITIPFELVTRHIIVQVSVNKSRPLAFVLDTGANQAIVRMDVAKELGLSLIGSVSAGEAVALEFNPSGHPVVKAIVTSQGAGSLERSFMFDIGSGGALVLHSPFVTEHRLPGPDMKTIRAIGGAGAGGRTAGRFGRVTTLRIGSFVIANPIALFSEDTAGAFADPSLAGNIGARIASRFRIFFDYGRRRMILEPSPTFAEPFDHAFSGIALRAERPDYHAFRVREVLEESPATDAGLAVGDIIVSIDGAPAESLTLSAINEMLEKPVTRELVIRRGEQTMRTTLTPKRPI